MKEVVTRHPMAQGQDEASRRLRRKREKKVQLFTLALGFIVAGGALGGLFVGLWMDDVWGMAENPAPPILLSLAGLSLSVLAAYYITKKLLAKWLA